MGVRTTAFGAEVFSKPCDTRAIEKRSTVSRCYACYMVVEYSTPDDAPPVVLLQISQNMLSGGV